MLCDDFYLAGLFAKVAIKYAYLKLPARASQYFDNAMELETQNPLVYANKGRYHYLLHDYEDAVECLTVAEGLYGEDLTAECAGYLAFTLYEMARYDESKKYSKMAIRLNPKAAGYYMNLANIYYREKQYSKSIRECKLALLNDPDIIPVHMKLQLIYRERKEYEKAEFHCKRMMEIRPQWDHPYRLMAVDFERRGEFKRALIWYDKALDFGTDHMTYFGLASVYQKLNKTDLAIEHINKVIELEPKVVSFLEFRRDLYEQTGQYLKAQEDQHTISFLELDQGQ